MNIVVFHLDKESLDRINLKHRKRLNVRNMFLTMTNLSTCAFIVDNVPEGRRHVRLEEFCSLAEYMPEKVDFGFRR